MQTPKPFQAVRGSTTGRPIMALLDLLGRRWVLRIVWELREEALGFRELQHRCDDMSSSVLAQRLNDCAATGITEQVEGKYSLTEEGLLLLKALSPLNEWAQRWAGRETPNSAS